MRLGWDEIRRRARAFSEEWRDAHYEKGETQPFYEEFFRIFGVKRRSVATFERRVQLLNNKSGFMDLFWPRVLLVEQKSARLDLDRAGVQALDYIDGLPEAEQPRYVLTCDFQTWRLLDLDTGTETRFALAELHAHVEAFAFILGRQRSFETQAGVTIKAAELMGRLHDALAAANYRGHDLEQLLVRLLFCLFADDTGIFQPKDIFLQLIENDTREDGSDVGRVLVELFDVLDTPNGQNGDGQNGTTNERQHNLPGELDAFPYVNGALFAGRLRTPVFDAAMRALLLDAARHDWSGVSPAIFGSLFQSVMSAAQRRRIGAHYTSEANILKVIGPLFLDDLRAELATIVARRSGRDAALDEFVRKLARLTFLDPACGCGNFLVVAYRELRRLELDALEARWPKVMTDTGEERRQGMLDPGLLSMVKVGQFHGIEVEEFPARIAEVAMWMADHLANNALGAAFSTNYARIPLRDSARIVHADALDLDWASVCPPERLYYIMGNPPFVGAKFQTPEQRAQVRRIAQLGGSGGTLDLVAAWFIKAGQYVNYSVASDAEDEKTRRLAGSPARRLAGSPGSGRLRRDQLDLPGRTGRTALAHPVRPLRAGDRVRPSHVQLGQRGARRGARPCRRHRPDASQRRACGEAAVQLSRHQGRADRDTSRGTDGIPVRRARRGQPASGRARGGAADQWCSKACHW